MECLSLLSAPAIELVKCVIVPVGHQIGYIVHYKRNTGSLREKVEDLETLKKDVERSVERARRGGDLIKHVVETWLARADTIHDEVMGLSSEVEGINSCFKGWCCSRYHIGKEAKKKIAIVTGLLEEGRNFSSLSEPAPPPGTESIPTGDFQDFASRESAVKRVIEALKDEKVNIVGVYGMGGVGKTTLTKQIQKKIKDQHFDEVVTASVTQNPDLKKIQDEIAEGLGLTLLDVSQAGRTGRLCKRLKEEKRVLVILDDLWKRLDLAEVGIPYRDDHKGCCKVLITTRDKDVCNQMETQAEIELKALSKPDSWILFQQKTNNVVDNPALQTLAREVVDECKGLPLAIATLGRALRGKKEKYMWLDASRQLKKAIYEGMSPVFSSIKVSYNYLGSEEIKKCFLFCCFFPEDYKFTHVDLMIYILGEELLQNVDSLEEARDRLLGLFNKLIASCLLLKDDKYEDIAGCKMMMHDIVRDTALSIASEESNGFLVKAGLQLREWPHRENLRTCIRMSLMGNQISELPDQPECPKLLTLSLLENSSLEKFPDNFFRKMTSLVTLDLKKTSISSLPSSLQCLLNLRVLRLDFTSLTDVSLVGKLTELKTLGLRRTLIKRLPEEIWELTNLRSLDFSYTDLETIPPNVLSRLSLLEELYMEGSFSGWEIEEMGDGNKARLAELVSLNRLTTLGLNVDNVNCLSKDIPICSENLTNFSIRATEQGNNWQPESLRNMSLTTTSDPMSNWVKVLLKRTYELHLFYCEGLQNVVELDAGGFNDLKSLYIEDCHEMEYLMSVAEGSSEIVFGGLEKLHVEECNELKEVFQLEGIEEGCVMIPKLREMYLEDLPKLTTLWKVVQNANASSTILSQTKSCDVSCSFPPVSIVPNLTKLEIRSCDSLNHIFPIKLLQGLEQLQELRIHDCSKMKEIIVHEEEVKGKEAEDNTMLPQLKILTLSRLPKLSSFCKGVLFYWPSLEYLSVAMCPNLKQLPLGPQSVPKIREVFGEVQWFEDLEWEDQSIKSRLLEKLI